MPVKKIRGLTVVEWSERLGVSKEALYVRARKYGWDKAVDMGAPGENIPTFGKMYEGKNMTQWADDLGIAVNTLSQRVSKLGWKHAVSVSGPIPLQSRGCGRPKKGATPVRLTHSEVVEVMLTNFDFLENATPKELDDICSAVFDELQNFLKQ